MIAFTCRVTLVSFPRRGFLAAGRIERAKRDGAPASSLEWMLVMYRLVVLKDTPSRSATSREVEPVASRRRITFSRGVNLGLPGSSRWGIMERVSRMARIEEYRFGRIVVDGQEHSRDLIILPERVVPNWWRAQGHSLVLDDLEAVLDELPERLFVGTGASGQLQPDPATLEALRSRGIEVTMAPTDEAVRLFADADPASTPAALPKARLAWSQGGADMPEIKNAIENAVRYLSEHPDEARYTDSFARATLDEALRVEVEGPDGLRVTTDMPSGVGGRGEGSPPGLVFPAALGACGPPS